jgi:hypothetical protein
MSYIYTQRVSGEISWTVRSLYGARKHSSSQRCHNPRSRRQGGLSVKYIYIRFLITALIIK